MLLRFKSVILFYAEDNDFGEKSPADSADTLGVKNFVKITLFRTVSERKNVFFTFYAEIQDGHQNWRENNFWDNSPVDYEDMVGIKNFVEIALMTFPICVFAFYADIQDSRQKWQENDFWEKSPIDSANTLRVKNFVEILNRL